METVPPMMELKGLRSKSVELLLLGAHVVGSTLVCHGIITFDKFIKKGRVFRSGEWKIKLPFPLQPKQVLLAPVTMLEPVEVEIIKWPTTLKT